MAPKSRDLTRVQRGCLVADSVKESEFQSQVIQFARLHRWTVAHFRTVRVQRANGATYYETPVAADGAGFPDLILVREGRLVAAELKVGRNRTSEDQVAWLSRLRATGAETHVWYPADWTRIVEVLS